MLAALDRIEYYKVVVRCKEFIFLKKSWKLDFVDLFLKCVNYFEFDFLNKIIVLRLS
ncbi:hypothetical protein LEP1GSC034_2782 [Leptospira interrogans str. 2003000735]|uniref:Uncharacterized protein n=2 Tax=Leptospira interrogans TaxID=173 RepID=N1UND4_LEPIR|nr:hypothetical protein LEP1GSC117_2851 [Leptospira interrogans serovar Icterohaemorrhagiae str. Verdun LP]EKP73968.1 hypothetical protein LEP1GSC173_2511 [Leptospira interrogans str. HAI1594]EKQ36401.1 hypothetical protein LEP1GSC025_2670 [Leptospira interrogans str. 2002000621]EKQ47893.1 hypothetical protein LEP1GSC026_3513 [Leptospira interrogans str. 2002000623]EMF73550.1 hypothetical protein LEP1GSC148_1131 [Leptospira interrogans serovar Canicola str. LT1962]EMG20324.1 hypothetical prote